MKAKYGSALYDARVVNNGDGTQSLMAKRKDELGQEVSYVYSNNPIACNNYQQNHLSTVQSYSKKTVDGVDLLRAICPKGAFNEKAEECHAMFAEYNKLEAISENKLSVSAFAVGEFMQRGTLEAMLGIFDSSMSHVENFGGTAFLVRKKGHWRLKDYQPGGPLSECFVLAGKARDIYACSTSYTGNGGYFQGEFSQKTGKLFSWYDDGASTCPQFISAVKLTPKDLNHDGLQDLEVKFGWEVTDNKCVQDEDNPQEPKAGPRAFKRESILRFLNKNDVLVLDPADVAEKQAIDKYIQELGVQ